MKTPQDIMQVSGQVDQQVNMQLRLHAQTQIFDKASHHVRMQAWGQVDEQIRVQVHRQLRHKVSDDIHDCYNIITNKTKQHELVRSLLPLFSR